jgi:ferredoxin
MASSKRPFTKYLSVVHPQYLTHEDIPLRCVFFIYSCLFLQNATTILMLKSNQNNGKDMASQSKERRFYSETQLHEIANDIDRAITIPVNVMVEADHMVYDFSEVKTILSRASKIVVENCGCRTEYGNCDSPRDVCLSLDKEAEAALIKEGINSREISLDEALDVLKRSHQAGLVHMAYVMKGSEKPGILCSCCTCCCHTLGGLLRNGVHAQVLKSNYIAQDDSEKCLGCGTCIDRCVFMARNMNEGSLNYDESQCMGCGLCVTTCPSNAISMVPRE